MTDSHDPSGGPSQSRARRAPGAATGDKTAATLVPSKAGVKARRQAAAGRRACPLWRAVRDLFGAAAARAPVMLIGEQPGHREDEGLPFVGPAGGWSTRRAGPGRDRARRTYRTNVVNTSSGSQGQARIHQTPSKLEVEACRPGRRRAQRVRPDVVAILGRDRGEVVVGTAFG